MKKSLLWVLFPFLTLLGSSASPPLWDHNLQRDLAALTKRGFTYRLLDNHLIELRDPLTSAKHLKSLQEQDEARIRAWAAQRAVPILEINPNTIDTSHYSGWYVYWGQLPLSNGLGKPLVTGDVDRNGNAEVYGNTRIGVNFETKIFEIDTNGTSRFLFLYDPLPGLPRDLSNVDSDSLTEIVFSYVGLISDFEQATLTGLPTQLGFRHERYQGNLDPGYTGIYLGSLDGDNLTDFLYKGSECDSIDTTHCITKVYVAEYNRQVNNFIRVWSTDFDLNGNVAGVGGFAVGDFDGDGKPEFAVAELGTHRVFVVENTGDNSYRWTWQDSTPFVNLYFTVSGDVDHDSKPEFFVGATSNGSWTTMYEADSNDHYSPKFIIHLLSGGLFDEPTYLTTDVDGDGILELVIMSGNDLYIFKSKEDNAYYLWYLKREDTKDAVQFYDFNHDGKEDFIISKYRADSLGRGVDYADYYRATGLASVKELPNLPCEMTLKQNYPNPFNPSTTIEYSIPIRAKVTLGVYDLLGRRVAALVDGEENPGQHTVIWNGAAKSSGIYFCRLKTIDHILTIKLLLLK